MQFTFDLLISLSRPARKTLGEDTVRRVSFRFIKILEGELWNVR